MAQPLGRWIVAASGLGVIGAAIAQFYRAYTGKFAKHLQVGQMSADQGHWALHAGRAGFAARGVAFGVFGWFFVAAALHDNASEAGGLAQALQALAGQSTGPILLGVVGAGLTLFGIYSLIEARYRRIE